MIDRLKQDLLDLMRVPGLAGHEGRVRQALAERLQGLGVKATTDRMGNLFASFDGDGPKVLVFAHMDQLGFVVRRIEPEGLLRLERLGGVPERALAGQEILVYGQRGLNVPGVIANKSHHATAPDEKYRVLPYAEVFVDAGFASAAEAEAAGVQIGAPVVYAPAAQEVAQGRVLGTSVDDRAGCAVLLELARRLKARTGGPPVHLAFTVQEEFNLRGAQTLAQRLEPDIAIQLDLMLATDTPD
ncbi:MAG: M20/M25/M40 family metallo-hydrolase, partial [Pseudomonadota bacterium]